MLKAVIFDMDGVLIDSQPLHYEADKAALARLGCIVDTEYTSKFAGTSGINRFAAYKADLGYAMDSVEAAKMREEIMLDMFKSGVEPTVGSRELLESIKSNGTLAAVASSSSYELIYAVLRALGEEAYFDKIVSGDDMEKSKPAPDIFLSAAEKLGAAPEECVVIEDSENGVLAAKAAGMRVIGYINPTSGVQDLSRADMVIDDFRKLSYNDLSEVLI